MKNLGKKTVKLRYKLPATKYFSMEFPETLRLSPGMSCAVAVTFRPIRKERYDDFIEFVVPGSLAGGGAGNNSFVIPVRAVLPEAGLSAPRNVDFGFCACRELAERSVALTNAGEVALEYAWEVDAPFAIEPREGSLAPGKSINAVVTFTPSNACVHVSTARCVAKGWPDATHEMAIKGIGKYPFLSLAESHKSFGEVLVGQVAEREVALTNEGLVPASFAAVRRDGGEGAPECFFSVSPASGTLQPGESRALRLSFAPQAAGAYSCEQFLLRAAGACATAALTLEGTARGPEVTAEPAVLDFGDVRAGESASRVLYLHNAAEAPASFALTLPGQGAFALSRAAGVVPPRGSAHVTVTFAPTSAANFVQRHRVLVKDSGAVAGFAVMGTCFSDALRPPPFTPEDVACYAAKNGEADPLVAPHTWEHLFATGTEPDAAVRLDTSELEFGGVDPMRAGEARELRVSNNTGAKITVQWARAAAGLPEAQRAFVVHPEEADVKPGASACFKVAFRPRASGCYYSQSLECTAYVKAMRNFRLVADGAFVPPWSAALHCTGHTFAGAGEAFTPKAAFSPRVVHFAPVEPGEAAYRTVLLDNAGDTPVRFEVQDSALSRAFACRPRKGVIPAHGFQLVALRFRAGRACSLAERAVVVLNNSSAIELPLHAAAQRPRVAVEGVSVSGDTSTLAFKPTCVGAATRREVTLHNAGRTPVGFAWSVPRRLQGCLSVEPAAGQLKGNERMPVYITFCPRRKRDLSGAIACETFSPGAEVVAHTLALGVAGKATVGAITVEPAVCDLGAMFVGKHYSATITLLNQSDGNMQYRLEAVDAETGELADDLGFDAPTGSLPARAFKSVVVSLRCEQRKRVNYSLRCIASTVGGDGAAVGAVKYPELGDGDGATAEGADPPPAVSLRGEAAYPTAFVTDVACRGWLAADLWRSLGVGRVNAELGAALSDAEVALNKHSFTVSTDMAMEALEKSGAALPFDLGVGAEGDAPTVVRVALTNKSSGLAAAWSLHLRGDHGTEIENWVDIGEANEEEDRHQDFIIENGIIEVSPRRGTLEPGATVTVEFKYTHGAAGTHEIPMLLYFQQGKRVRLDIVGRTLPHGEARLLPPPRAPHTLCPVPLGETDPPLQLVPLRAAGSAPLRYRLDTSPLDALQAASHGFRVLDVVGGAKGELPPGGVAYVKVRFQPLEARQYTVALPVAVEGGPASVLELECEGYAPGSGGGEGAAMPCAPPEGTLAPVPKARWPCFTPSQSLLEEAQLARLDSDMASFGDVAAHGTAWRVVTATNLTDAPLRFAWNLDAANGAVAAALAVSPATGVLPPRGAVACEVSLVAATPEDFEVTAECVFEPVMRIESPPKASAQALPDGGDDVGGEHDAEGDEVLASDTGPTDTRRRVRGARLSVVECGTESMSRRFPSLRMRTATSMAMREPPLTADSEGLAFFDSGTLSPRAPRAPRSVRLLGVEASVLSAAHFRSLMGPGATPQTQYASAASRAVPLAGGSARDGRSTADESAFVAAMLKRMLADAMDSDEVCEAIVSPPPHVVPTFEQVRQQPRPGGVPARLDDAAGAQVGSETCTEAANETAAVMAMPEFQEFAEYVLHGALLGICRDGGLTADGAP